MSATPSIFDQLRGVQLDDHTTRSIRNTTEFRRIAALPRRTDFHDLSAALTEHLKQPGGTMTLRREQAWAITELYDNKGLLGNLSVGFGKTLCTMIAPVVIGAKRPLLLIPAKLRDKTLKTDIPALAKHWKLHPDMRIMSYETLSQEKQADYLETTVPDIIIADECHHLRNFRSASVARRVARYLGQYGEHCIFMGVSGTITKRSLRDYAHLLFWALRDKSPLPVIQAELDEWADLLDERLSQRDGRSDRPKIGAMAEFCNPGESARDGFRRRLLETPGFVFTESPLVQTSEGADCSISILEFDVDPPPEITAAFRYLRSTWETPLALVRGVPAPAVVGVGGLGHGPAGGPAAVGGAAPGATIGGVVPGGEVISDALTFYRHAKELGMGFFYRWKWPPAIGTPAIGTPAPGAPIGASGVPEGKPDLEWLLARRNWKTFVRKTIMKSLYSGHRGGAKAHGGAGGGNDVVGSVAGGGLYDSEKQVAKACISGRLVPPADEYNKWRLISHDRKQLWGQSEPPKETVWVSEFIVDAGMKYLKDNPKGALVWVEHIALLEKFRERGALVFGGGENGIVDEGRLPATPAEAKAGIGRARSCVLSLEAHGEGKNLQAYHKNLFFAVAKSGVTWEQGIGRSHRTGQPADEIECLVGLHTIELWKSFEQARKDAAYIEATTGQKQRLGLADIVVASSDEVLARADSSDEDVQALWREDLERSVTAGETDVSGSASGSAAPLTGRAAIAAILDAVPTPTAPALPAPVAPAIQTNPLEVLLRSAGAY